jgi:hypothetical protein
LTSSSDLALGLCLASDRLLEFLFYSFLFFFFSLVLLIVGVVNALIKGRLRTMCGSRTDGWSLPGVMSD